MTLGKYSQLFQDSWGNTPPVVRALAVALDEQEGRLEKIRIALGFTDEWSPVYERRQRSGVSAAVKWAEKASCINGMGDMNRFVGEMAAGMDVIESKLGEVAERMPEKAAPIAEPERRGPGRPRRIA